MAVICSACHEDYLVKEGNSYLCLKCGVGVCCPSCGRSDKIELHEQNDPWYTICCWCKSRWSWPNYRKAGHAPLSVSSSADINQMNKTQSSNRSYGTRDCSYCGNEDSDCPHCSKKTPPKKKPSRHLCPKCERGQMVREGNRKVCKYPWCSYSVPFSDQFKNSKKTSSLKILTHCPKCRTDNIKHTSEGLVCNLCKCSWYPGPGGDTSILTANDLDLDDLWQRDCPSCNSKRYIVKSSDNTVSCLKCGHVIHHPKDQMAIRDRKICPLCRDGWVEDDRCTACNKFFGNTKKQETVKCPGCNNALDGLPHVLCSNCSAWIPVEANTEAASIIPPETMYLMGILQGINIDPVRLKKALKYLNNCDDLSQHISDLMDHISELKDCVVDYTQDAADRITDIEFCMENITEIQEFIDDDDESVDEDDDENLWGNDDDDEDAQWIPYHKLRNRQEMYCDVTIEDVEGDKLLSPDDVFEFHDGQECQN